MVVIHTNLGLQNQLDCAQALKDGFNRHGVAAEITGDKHQPGDVHIVQGPWYCYRDWLGKENVLYLDRCFYGCSKTIISLGWLKADGSREFRNSDKTQAKGVLPQLQPLKKKKYCAIVFGDYGRDPTEEWEQARKTYDAVWYRHHPADTGQPFKVPLRGNLDVVWHVGDVAIGHSSTVLIEAAINGLHTESTDPLHVVQQLAYLEREEWLTRLSWAQWGLDELRSGAFWEHLC